MAHKRPIAAIAIAFLGIFGSGFCLAQDAESQPSSVEEESTRSLQEVCRTTPPAAELVPIPPQTPLFGALAGNVRKEGDIVSPLENAREVTTR
jgi:hypothetical protein